MVEGNSNKNHNNNNEGWGMGLLLIFFHHNNNNNNNSHANNKVQHFNNHHHSVNTSKKLNLLLSKTQSTLSICALLVFTTLLLFTLSTFEPTATTLHNNGGGGGGGGNGDKSVVKVSRRLLLQRRRQVTSEGSHYLTALQGIGEVYLRGSKAMGDLIVGHVSEDASEREIRSFVRVLVHSGLLSKVDIVFVFASLSARAEFGPVVKSECSSLLRLVQLGRQLGSDELGPGLTRYLRPVGDGGKDTLWGRRPGGNSTSAAESTRAGRRPEGGSTRSGQVSATESTRSGQVPATESGRASYGSVVGFEASELDPEESLSGFMDHVPMGLRRWACYPMLLGRVRRNFKHVMLVDVRSSLVMSDPFVRVRNKSSESVYMWSNSEQSRHGRKNTGLVNQGVVIGGSRGVRRFANAALTEIVRVSIEHKGKFKNTVSESGVVNQLVHRGHLLKSINLVTASESIPDSGSLAGFNSADSGSSFLGLSNYFSVVQRGQNGGTGSGIFDVDHVVMREICLSHKLFTSVYNDCLEIWKDKTYSSS